MDMGLRVFVGVIGFALVLCGMAVAGAGVDVAKVMRELPAFLAFPAFLLIEIIAVAVFIFGSALMIDAITGETK